MADEKIIFSMVGVSKTFTNQKKVLNNIYLSFFYGAKIGIIGLNGPVIRSVTWNRNPNSTMPRPCAKWSKRAAPRP